MPDAPDDLTASASAEWDALVAVAIVGTDRHRVPAPPPGWDTWATASDPAVAVLDRAAAVVAARRAGVVPGPPLAGVEPIAEDERPVCSPACTARLQRLLSGEHDLLLAEWFERCERVGVRLPWAVLPGLLLRGRRHPGLDLVVRRLAGPRAAWLAGVMPELGVRASPAVPAGRGGVAEPLRPPTRVEDSSTAVAGICGAFADRAVTWASAPQLRQLVAALDPAVLPGLIASLAATVFDPVTERARAELLGLAEFRQAMLRELDDCLTPAAGPVDPAVARPVP
jgi:hypothetical protein